MSIDKYTFEESIDLDFILSIPDHIDLKHIFLVFSHLDIELPNPEKDFGAGISVTNASIFLACVLSLSRLCFELGFLPFFESPKIKSLSRVSALQNDYMGIVRLRRIDFIHPSLYTFVIGSCIDTLKFANFNSLSESNLNSLFEKIQNKIVLPLRKIVSGGSSTVRVLRSAYEMGVPFFHLGLGVYQIGLGSKGILIDRSSTELDSATGSHLSQNKSSTSKILRRAGLPVPKHIVIEKEFLSRDIEFEIAYPVVVKPVDQDRGVGVSVDIKNFFSLNEAYAKARAASHKKSVIIEEQVSGVCNRLFISRGILVYAVTRHPLSIFGNGKSSIRKLVEEEAVKQNRRPIWNRGAIYTLDQLAIDEINRLGLTPECVPALGVRVSLRRIESSLCGGTDEDVTQKVHCDNVTIAVQAAELLSLDVVGVDIISKDITQPWHKNHAVITELNYAPLLGGAEISRSYLPKFLKAILLGDGMIDIVCAADMFEAFKIHANFLSKGVRCFVTSQDQTWDCVGEPVYFACNGIEKRIKALLCRRDVDAICYVS